MSDHEHPRTYGEAICSLAEAHSEIERLRRFVALARKIVVAAPEEYKPEVAALEPGNNALDAQLIDLANLRNSQRASIRIADGYRFALKTCCDALANYETLRPLGQWSEEDGPVLWWTLPVAAQPWVGSPGDDNWSDSYTHWTPILLPSKESQMDAELSPMSPEGEPGE